MSEAGRLPADWPAPPGVVAFTTLRHGAGVSAAPFDHFNLGTRAGDDPDAVRRNRAELVERFGLPSAPSWLRQVHGTVVVRATHPHPGPPPQAGEGGGPSLFARVEKGVASALPARRGAARLLPMEEGPATSLPMGEGPATSFPMGEGIETSLPMGEGAETSLPMGEGVATSRPGAAAPLLPPLAGEGRDGGEPEADAVVTDVPGTVLAILTADCLPVVIAARDGSEVAAAHAGWRGLAAGVLEATVAAMRGDAGDLLAWLGPAAGPQAYEVGQEVFDAFTAHDPRAAEAFLATRRGHWRVDLYALARQRLADAGVAEVHGGGLCTISDPARFFSHRRSTTDGSGRGGRMATLAWIEPRRRA